MKVLSKLATTALAGVLALCSVTSVTASAGSSYMYQPTGNMIYSFYKAGNLPISGNNKFGNTTMYVKYKEATDDFTIVSYKKEYNGDINLDGKVDRTDANMALDMVSMAVSGISISNKYTPQQRAAMCVSKPFANLKTQTVSGTDLMIDAQIINSYVSYVEKNGRSKYNTIEKYILSKPEYSKYLVVDELSGRYSYTINWEIPMVINVGCKNKYRNRNCIFVD